MPDTATVAMVHGIITVGRLRLTITKSFNGTPYILVTEPVAGTLSRHVCLFPMEWYNIKTVIPRVQSRLAKRVMIDPLDISVSGRRAMIDPLDISVSGRRPMSVTVDMSTKSVTITIEGKKKIGSVLNSLQICFEQADWSCLVSKQADITAGLAVCGDWALLDGVFAIGRSTLTIRKALYGSLYILVSRNLTTSTPDHCIWFADVWRKIKVVMHHVQSVLANPRDPEQTLKAWISDEKVITFTFIQMPRAVTILVTTPHGTDMCCTYMNKYEWNCLVSRQADIDNVLSGRGL